jgi:hypothetical protein
MDDEIDGWMDGKLHEKQPQCPLLNVIWKTITNWKFFPPNPMYIQHLVYHVI